MVQFPLQRRMPCLGLVIIVCALTRGWAHDYIFINESRSWLEAQTYCRENYSDLATVWSEWDLCELCAEGLNCTGAWIGLNNQQSKWTRRWRWSQLGQESTESQLRWGSGEPSDQKGKENCVSIHSDLSLSVQSCCSTRPFICYDDRSNISEVIHRNVMWSEALHFCRRRSTHLLSGLSQLNDPVLKEKIKASANSWWVGLFRDPWTWSNLTHRSSFRHWRHQHGFMCEDVSLTYGQCARLGPKGSWTSARCTEKNPFICYNPRPLNLTLVRQNLTWEEASAYCTHNHSRLLSVTSRGQQAQAEQAAREAHSEVVWLAAHYTCLLDLWLWSSGEFMVYKQWSRPEEESRCGQAAAMERGGRWVKKYQQERYNFICVW